MYNVYLRNKFLYSIKIISNLMDFYKDNSRNDSSYNDPSKKGQDDDIFEGIYPFFLEIADDQQANKPIMSSPKVKYGKYQDSPEYPCTEYNLLDSQEKKSQKEVEDSKDNGPASFFGINKSIYRKNESWEAPKT